MYNRVMGGSQGYDSYPQNLSKTGISIQEIILYSCQIFLNGEKPKKTEQNDSVIIKRKKSRNVQIQVIHLPSEKKKKSDEKACSY